MSPSVSSCPAVTLRAPIALIRASTRSPGLLGSFTSRVSWAKSAKTGEGGDWHRSSTQPFEGGARRTSDPCGRKTFSAATALQQGCWLAHQSTRDCRGNLSSCLLLIGGDGGDKGDTAPRRECTRISLPRRMSPQQESAPWEACFGMGAPHPARADAPTRSPRIPRNWSEHSASAVRHTQASARPRAERGAPL